MAGINKNDVKKVERVGLERFLQLEPQNSGIAAILRNTKKMEVMSIEDWKVTVENLLHRSVI